MSVCIRQTFPFASRGKRRVEPDFEGGEVSSDGGLLLLRRVDRRVDLTARAGAPTPCRMENRADRRCAMEPNELPVTLFIESHPLPPREVIVDFDATDDAVHGNQQGRFFHGYYDGYRFLPLHVFCGGQPLLSWLRPANRDAARGARAALKWLVKRLCAAWPRVRIVWRADSGFCRWRMLRWSERHGMDYIVGLARNPRLAALSVHLAEKAAREYAATGRHRRVFGWIYHAAGAWDAGRSAIAHARLRTG